MRNRLWLYIVLPVLLTPLAPCTYADFRQNVSQGWAELFYTGTLGSARCSTISDIQPAIELQRSLVDSPLRSSLLFSARTRYVESATNCEWSIRFDLLLGQAMTDQLAPACGWTTESASSKAAHVSRCFAEDLRELVHNYRQSSQTVSEPDAVEDPLP